MDTQATFAILVMAREAGKTGARLSDIFKRMPWGEKHSWAPDGKVPGLSPAYLTTEAFQGLLDLGLIRLEGPADVLAEFNAGSGLAIGYFKGHENDVRVFLTDKFPQIQEALGYSLTETSQRTYKSVIATPMFNGYVRPNVDVFVIMPFATAFDSVHAALAAAAKGTKLKIVRGDDLFGSSYVIDDIWSCLLGAKYVIADCTGTNPNVMYELGIAHTLGRPTLLVSQRAEDIPFDLRHWRYHLYDLNDLSQLTATVASFVRDEANA